MSTTAAPTIEVRGLTHRFRGHVSLDDVSVSFAPGVTGLLGPNGAGKTTLLRTLATVLQPTAGQIGLLGRDARSEPGRTEVRRRLGYAPQELTVPRGFTVFGFLEYVAVLKEWTDPRPRRAEARRVLDLVGLGAETTVKVHRLSGGMRRRLTIAQALLGSPELLILDEPTNGFDPEQRAALRALLGDLGGHVTVVIATHQTEDVGAICDNVVLLDAGRVSFAGSVSHFVDAARGHVWFSDRREPSAVATTRSANGRFTHVGQPPLGARLTEPTLEEAYLWYRGAANESSR